MIRRCHTVPFIFITFIPSSQKLCIPEKYDWTSPESILFNFQKTPPQKGISNRQNAVCKTQSAPQALVWPLLSPHSKPALAPSSIPNAQPSPATSLTPPLLEARRTKRPQAPSRHQPASYRTRRPPHQPGSLSPLRDG